MPPNSPFPNLFTSQLANKHALLIPLLLIFWAISLSGLAHYPAVHYDEPIIVSPGYKLFQEGVYGSDMYSGFHDQERIYLEVTPTMSLIQGLVTHLIGIGVWQMRFTAVIAGLLILPLSYIVGRRLTGSHQIALLTVFLLLFWRWTPGGDEFLGSGIFLLDVTRLARYDILVPIFGLLSFWAWLGQRHFWAGLMAGMAGFTNIYGLFWIPALVLLYFLDPANLNLLGFKNLAGFFRATISNLAKVRTFLWAFLSGALLPWLVWLAILLTNWEAATGQFTKHNGRFDLFNPAFYWTNLITEVQRYGLGFRDPSSYGRVGFWLVVVGLPAGTLFLLHRTHKHQDRRALHLLIPLLTLPTLLALLVNFKRHYYLTVLLPLAAILIAWLAHTLYQRRQRWLTLTLTSLLLLFTLQGLLGIRQLNQAIAQVASPFAFYDDLAKRVPAGTRIVASPIYWPIFAERDFRSLGLLFVITNHEGQDPLTFPQALNHIRPDYLLLDPTFTQDLITVQNHTGQPRVQPFWDFMAAHNAQQIDQITTPHGQTIQIYHLQWEE